MQSIGLTGTSPLFQVYKPETVNNRDADGHAGYIELPDINMSTLDKAEQFKALSLHSDFPDIKAQFLGDINDLKGLANVYIGSRYDDAINIFYEKVAGQPDYIRSNLVHLYRKTRYLIHQVVARIKEYQAEGAGKARFDESRGVSAGSVAISKDGIAFVLHDCLEGIENCLEGIHTRFTSGFLNLEAVRGGLSGRLYQVKTEVLGHFIQCFLFEAKRERILNSTMGMEVHYFSSLYNLSCDQLGLEVIKDPQAPPLEGKLIGLFLKALPIAVNQYTILRKLADGLFDELSDCLAKLGVSDWLTTPFGDDDLTPDRQEVLYSQWLKPVNQLFAAKDGKELHFWTIFEDSTDDTYCLDRCRERFLAWLTTVFESASGTVFTSLPEVAGRKQYIGTINHHFFWVFASDQLLGNGAECSYVQDNHTSVQLYHLDSIDFSSWSKEISSVLLAQAMEQTREAEQIVSFFLGSTTRRQLHKTGVQVMAIVHNQLEAHIVNKRLRSGQLADGIYEYLLSIEARDRKYRRAPKLELSQVEWLIETPVLGSVLSRLKGRCRKVSSVVEELPLSRVLEFSFQNIKILVESKSYKIFFRHAWEYGHASGLAKMFMTSRFDKMINCVGVGGREITPLIMFSSQGQTEGVKYLLSKQKLDIECKDHLGRTALLLAVEKGNADCLEHLLSHKNINVNALDENKRTAVMIAVGHGKTDCLKLLLSHESVIVVNRTNTNGETALDIAIRNENAGCLNLLLKRKGINVNGMNKNGETALEIAVRHGKTDCLKLLLSHKSVNVNRTNKNGETALEIAIRNENADCLKLLLEHEGVNVNGLNKNGETALGLAMRNENADCFKLLLEHKGVNVNGINKHGETTLELAIRNENAACFKLLLEHEGVNVNGTNENGRQTLTLEFAIKSENSYYLKLLLEHKGVNVNGMNKRGETALMLAMDLNDIGCVELLLSHKDVNVDAIDEMGETALMYAAHRGGIECLKLLLKSSPEVTVSDRLDWTALMYAISSFDTDLDCVKLLLAHEGINRTNKNGKTALMCAAHWGNTDCLKLLLAYEGVNVNGTDKDGKTALMFAACCGNKDCLKLLLAHEGVNINGTDKDGRTALRFAAESAGESSEGHADCFNLLLAHKDMRVIKDSGWILTRILKDIENLSIKSRYGSYFPPYRLPIRCYFDSIELLLAYEDIDLGNIDLRKLVRVAVKNDHVGTFKQLLARSDISVHQKNQYGDSLLTLALSFGSAACVEVLLAHKDIDIEDDYPAMLNGAVARAGKRDFLKQLFTQEDIDLLMRIQDWAFLVAGYEIIGRPLELQDIDVKLVMVALAAACRHNHGLGKVRDALHTLMNKLRQVDVREDYGACFQLLLEYGSSRANKQDKKQSTRALMYAVAHDHVEYVRFLLADKDANVNEKDEKGRTALMMAEKYENADCARLLREHENTRGNKCEDIKGIEKNKKHQPTALMLAVGIGLGSCVGWLLEDRDTMVNETDKIGRTALMLAASRGHANFVKLLLENGADVNVWDKSHRTALMWAAHCGYENCLKRVLEKGANVNDFDEGGRTALMFAANYGYENCLKLLLEKGANVNDLDDGGRTALMLAASYGHANCLKLLLEKDANVNDVDEGGRTALMYAENDGSEDCLKLLRENGANVNDLDEGGCTSLMLAPNYGNADCLRLPLENGNSVRSYCVWNDLANAISGKSQNFQCSWWPSRNDEPRQENQGVS